jgi:uncharacterized BrkB/YihY/UPF0761 family membrane protein
MGRARTRLLDSAERLTTWGPLGPVAEVGWRVYRRDQQIAGSVLAAAVAYRIFIWLLPLALVAVAGLGLFTSDATHVAADAGVTGYMAQSVSQATNSTSLFARVAVIVSGSVVFLYESYALLRTLRAVSAFAWGIPVRAMRRPAQQILLFLGFSAALLLVLNLTPKITDLLPLPFGFLTALASLLIVPLYYVLISHFVLPNRAPNWSAFLPGAALVYVTYAVVHLLAALVIVPWVAHKQATYGVLGVAAGVLFTMFIFARVLELGFSLNAVLCEQGIAIPTDRARTKTRA